MEKFTRWSCTARWQRSCSDRAHISTTTERPNIPADAQDMDCSGPSTDGGGGDCMHLRRISMKIGVIQRFLSRGYQCRYLWCLYEDSMHNWSSSFWARQYCLGSWVCLETFWRRKQYPPNTALPTLFRHFLICFTYCSDVLFTIAYLNPSIKRSIDTASPSAADGLEK